LILSVQLIMIRVTWFTARPYTVRYFFSYNGTQLRQSVLVATPNQEALVGLILEAIYI
jgi:hypothetical protein